MTTPDPSAYRQCRTRCSRVTRECGDGIIPVTGRGAARDTPVVDPRLRVAVDSSLAWYDALCALHGVACQVEDGLWVAGGQPPPLHSAVKTVEPGVDPVRVAEIAASRGGVADSFGDLGLESYGFDLLFAARWIHRPADDLPARDLAPGWSLVTSADGLAAWTAQHDTAEVLLPALLARSSFQVLARHDDGDLAAGAVLHVGTGAVSISNVWMKDPDGDTWRDIVRNAGALWPGRALVGYERGTDLESALAVGFADIGPQLVWV